MIWNFATWCGPCKITKPEYKKLKEMNEENGNNIVVACINGSGKGTFPSEQKLKERIKDIFPDFRGYPHIAVIGADGKVKKTHEGPRKAEDIMKTVKNM
jgi:thiol-disulfide isomerase/thioredoxin